MDKIPGIVGLKVQSAPPKDREAERIYYSTNVDGGAFILGNVFSEIIRPLISSFGSFGSFGAIDIRVFRRWDEENNEN